MFSQPKASSFIISNQRTGSTALASFLSNYYQNCYHEPFKEKRIWCKFYQHFEKTNRFSEELLNSIFNSQLLVKHCNEVQNEKFNYCLLENIMKIEAPLLLLFRRNETLRLASLKKALETGIWFSNQKEPLYKEVLNRNRLNWISKQVQTQNEMWIKKSAQYPKRLIIFYEDLFDKDKSEALIRKTFNLF